MAYYCKKCEHMVGQWSNKNNFYHVNFNCNFYDSEKNSRIFFLDCTKCDAFIGLFCCYICRNCFGEYPLIKDEEIKKWFVEYKKLVYLDKKKCPICNSSNLRCQYWFFEELTFFYNNIKDVKNKIEYYWNLK